MRVERASGEVKWLALYSVCHWMKGATSLEVWYESRPVWDSERRKRGGRNLVQRQRGQKRLKYEHTDLTPHTKKRGTNRREKHGGRGDAERHLHRCFFFFLYCVLMSPTAPVQLEKELHLLPLFPCFPCHFGGGRIWIVSVCKNSIHMSVFKLYFKHWPWYLLGTVRASWFVEISSPKLCRFTSIAICYELVKIWSDQSASFEEKDTVTVTFQVVFLIIILCYCLSTLR